ncbi:MAG: hypothetical protein QM778_14980 [Myxococcales bacterium]
MQLVPTYEMYDIQRGEIVLVGDTLARCGQYTVEPDGPPPIVP